MRVNARDPGLAISLLGGPDEVWFTEAAARPTDSAAAASSSFGVPVSDAQPGEALSISLCDG